MWWMYMIVYTLYKLSMSVYGYVLYESVSCVCLWFSDEPVLFYIYICIYVWTIIIVVFVYMFGWPQGR